MNTNEKKNAQIPLLFTSSFFLPIFYCIFILTKHGDMNLEYLGNADNFYEDEDKKTNVLTFKGIRYQNNFFFLIFNFKIVR